MVWGVDRQTDGGMVTSRQVTISLWAKLGTKSCRVNKPFGCESIFSLIKIKPSAHGGWLKVLRWYDNLMDSFDRTTQKVGQICEVFHQSCEVREMPTRPQTHTKTLSVAAKVMPLKLATARPANYWNNSTLSRLNLKTFHGFCQRFKDSR